MESIFVKDTALYFQEKQVFSFEYRIDKYKSIGNHFIVLLSVPDGILYNENVFCFDNQGNFLWQIEKREEHNEECPYTGIESGNKDELVLYRWCGVEIIADIHTGKITSAKFVK